MYIDSRLMFSDKQVTTGAANSTNTVDVGPKDRNIGPGYPLWVVVQLDAAQTGAISVTLQSAANEAFTSPDTLASVNVPANSPAGSRFVIGAPYSNQRYLRLRYSNATASTAWLTSEPPTSWQAYPAQV